MLGTTMIGRTLGQYRIEEQLGAGGMGVVYRAHDTRLERTVALKLLTPQHAPEEAAWDRLLSEARSASALNHPHIATIYEVGQADGQSYIAMEYVPGRPLSALAPADGLPVETVIRYGTQIADALAHAHERGVIHRDLKTSNVVITPEGRAKVLDFGLARRLQKDQLTEATLSRATLSKGAGEEAGGIAGTLHYLAPELLRGEAADARSDLWALGVLLYETASGELPFHGKTGFELSSAILRETPAPLPPRVPAGLRAIIQRCLAKEPGQRYQRASEARSALEAIQSDTAVAAIQAPGPRRVPRRALALGLLALTGVLSLVLLLGRQKLRSPAPAAPAGPARTALAILPLRPLSGQPADGELALGLTDAIVTGLGGSPELLVRPTRAVLGYQDKLTDPVEAGKALQVDTVLDGTLQKSGTRLRISVQLWRVSDRASLWAQKYDVGSGDVFAVQDEIGSKVAEALRVQLSAAARQRLGTPYSKNPELYTLMAHARALVLRQSQESLQTAIPIFEEVLRKEPENALAHALLAEACRRFSFLYDPNNVLWLQKGESHAGRALELDGSLAEAYSAQAGIAWTPQNHFQNERAIALYRKALALNPNLSYERSWMGTIYWHVGLFERAIEEHRRGLEIEPKNIFALRGLAEDYLGTGEPRRAEESARAALAVDPEFASARADLVEALIYDNKLSEAESLAREDYLGGWKFQAPRLAALIAARRGKLAEAEALALQAAEKAKGFGHFHHMAFTLGQIYALAGKKSQAVEWLRRAATDGMPAYPRYRDDPYLKGLRGYAEYERFLEQLRPDWERRRREL